MNKQRKKDKPIKHGSFKELSNEAAQKKAHLLEDNNSLGGYAQIPHSFHRDLLPIVLEYDNKHRDIVILYTFLLAHVNGDINNDRYMAAFPTRDTIIKKTGLVKNRLTILIKILKALGMLKVIKDRTPLGHSQNLYYIQYYSDLSEKVIRERLDKLLLSE